jgi:hypothetical protein
MAHQNIFLTIKNASQNFSTNLFASVVFQKNIIFNSRFYYMQMLRSAEKAPPLPCSSIVLCWEWSNSGSFQPEAVTLVMAFE